jgi:hypothetical protein
MNEYDEYDTPWKDALTRYFSEFMAFYFRGAYEQIDWGQPCVFLEQELAQVTRDAALGGKRVDKLVRVTLRDGGHECVFVHVDVQGNVEREFAERVFVYNYRIYDRYRRPVASLALLADGSRNWKPTAFEYQLFGCEMGIRFPIAKLSDYAGRLDELLGHANVFGLVTAAHILTQQTKGRDVERHEAKWRLARILFQRKLDRQRVVDLFNIIDWMMKIPEPLQFQLMQDIRELERDRNMPYISSFQQLGRQEGQRELLRCQLERRFGPLSGAVQQRLANASVDELKAWSLAVLDAPTLERVLASH